MIKYITGDLIRDGRGILCHQVNFLGVMGGGIAYSIRQILPPKEFARYHRYCMIHGEKALGSVLWIKLPSTGRVVANLFCQGDNLAQQVLTDYNAMRKCFTRVRAYAKRFKLPVYIPANIGCGIGGGDWHTVEGIIKDVFGREPVDVTIARWERQQGC